MTRRLVQSIHTREVIPVAMAGDSACYLLVVTGDQIEILSNLLNYAHRKINWCDEVVDAAHYYLPDDADWDDIEAVVDDLECRLMSECKLTELVTALECICAASTVLSQNQQQTGFGGTLPEEITQYLPYAPVPVPTDPQVDEDACALAQLTWQAMYEQITEVILPYVRTGFEGALAAIVALIAVATGGISLIVAEIIVGTGFLVLIEGAYSSAEKNITNWLFSAKDEIICAAYFGWLTGGQQGAADAVEQFIADATEISLLDKEAAKIALALALPTARIAWAAQSQWALDNVTPGACDECEEPTTCLDFCEEGWVVTEEPGYAIVDNCILKMVEPPVGLQEMAGRVWDIVGDSFDVYLAGKGALNEEHYAVQVDFDFQDAGHSTIGTAQYHRLEYTDGDFDWFDNDVAAPGCTHVHVAVRGITMTPAWCYCVSVVEHV